MYMHMRKHMDQPLFSLRLLGKLIGLGMTSAAGFFTSFQSGFLPPYPPLPDRTPRSLSISVCIQTRGPCVPASCCSPPREWRTHARRRARNVQGRPCRKTAGHQRSERDAVFQPRPPQRPTGCVRPGAHACAEGERYIPTHPHPLILTRGHRLRLGPHALHFDSGCPRRGRAARAQAAVACGGQGTPLTTPMRDGCWAPRQQGSRAHRTPLRPLACSRVRTRAPSRESAARAIAGRGRQPRGARRKLQRRKTSTHLRASTGWGGVVL